MNTSNQFRSRKTRKSRLAGFSTIELVLVLAIMLIVAGFVIPSAVQTWYAMELRASAAQVSDLMQQARMLAAKKNATYPIRYNLANGVQQAYIDLNNNNALDAGEPSVLLPRMTAAAGAPTGGAGQPSAYVLVGDSSTGTPFDNANTLAFSPRGLPCNYSAPPTCSTPATSYFVYYFQNGRPNGWSAVLVTKAGRSKILMWNGSTWH